MRRSITRTLAAAVALGAAAAIPLMALPRATAAPRQQAAVSPCVVTHTKTAGPSVVRLGETVTVTMTVRAGCPDVDLPLHVVLVIDASGSMDGGRGRDVKSAARRFVQQLDLASNPDTKVGVVQFNQRAQRLCSLTNAEPRVLLCIDRISASGGTRIDLGIFEGMRVLAQDRSTRPPQVREVLVVLTDGDNNAGCGPVMSAMRQARGQGIQIVTVCVGPDCDAQCMRQVALAPRFFFEADGLAELNGAFDQIARLITSADWISLDIIDQLPMSMGYVADSAEPPLGRVAGPSGYLVWYDWIIPTEGVTYTLKVVPTKLGHQPTNVRATGRLINWERREQAWLFDVPYVLVIDPSVPPTVTITAPPPPTATHTPVVPTVPPTATPGWPGGVLPGVCDVALQRVPAAVVSAALANPGNVRGFGERCNPSQPPSPWNRLKDQLSIEQPSKPYHPLYNSVAWKCGCP